MIKEEKGQAVEWATLIIYKEETQKSAEVRGTLSV